MSDNLATALAAFQGSGYAIPRLREVTVETKTGSYKFEYAPHELIVAAIRKPLADNGLAVSQLLATTEAGRPGLRTILMHSSGESIDSVFPLPVTDGMKAQELGSAITYIRRYALSAILGLATEDDDDGNRASGNTVSDRRDRPAGNTPGDGSLIGVAEVAKAPWDTEVRMTPDGPSFGFGLKEGRQIVRVTAFGDLAQSIAVVWPSIVGKRVECFGAVTPDEWVIAKGSANERKVPYLRLALERIATPDLILPATDTPIDSEIDALPLFDAAA